MEEPKEEQWKIVPNTGKNVYAVSNTGKIITFCKGTEPQELKGDICCGYRRVYIAGKWQRVSRIVAECFLENPEHKKEVHHKDKNKLNNNSCNL